MKKELLATLLRASFILGIMAIAAIPLSQVMVAETSVESFGYISTPAETATETEAASAPSAVSALMSGNVVGETFWDRFIDEPSSPYLP